MPVVQQLTIVPLDIVALTQAFFSGLAALLGAIAAIYSVIAASRSKRALSVSTANREDLTSVKANVELVERNTNSLTKQLEQVARRDGLAEGLALGRVRSGEDARLFDDGRTQGRNVERASVAARQPTAAPPAAPPPDPPLPVADARVGEAVDRMADAVERATDIQEKK